VLIGQLFACWRLFPSCEGEKLGFQKPCCAGDIDFCSASWYDSISELRSLAAKVVRKNMSEEEIVLSALNDDDLVAQMHDDLYDGLGDEITDGTNELLSRGWSPQKVLDEALVEGMRIVGIDFRDGILFVPEVLLSANAMKCGMHILRPLLAETGAEPIGTVVIGTVKGDIHDIGKNLVAMMLEGAGFEVFDLGINTDADKFIAAIAEHKPDILGMSALLTTTMPYMKVVIDTLKEKGLRNDYIVLVGGAPLNEEFGMAVGADAYCRDAAVAAETAKRLIAERRAAA
jgi:methylmalonyl-CoA mutase cobalamin-binding domain/chain